MIVFDENRLPYVTPKAVIVRFTIRVGTNDHNTVWSACNEDEYGLRDRSFSGVAFDIGAHIGSVAVALAVDNPDLTVLAVEPVEDNARLLWMNARDNGVEGRVRILKAAAGPPGVTETTLHSGFRGTEHAWHHAYIGATGREDMVAGWRLGAEHDISQVPSYDFGQLIEMAGAPSFVKIDCEGAEFGILKHPAVAAVPLIIGEWHNVPHKGRSSRRDDLRKLLPKHEVSFSGPRSGPGGFVAAR